MYWESTDNFGNLSVATSSASDLNELREDIKSMVDVVLARTPIGACFSVDVTYREVSAPSGNQVTHVLTVPLMETLETRSGSEESSLLLQELIRDVLSQQGLSAGVLGPWS